LLLAYGIMMILYIEIGRDWCQVLVEMTLSLLCKFQSVEQYNLSFLICKNNDFADVLNFEAKTIQF